MSAALTLCLGVCTACEEPAAADDNVFDAWARSVAEQGRWRGPTVPFPDPRPRPERGRTVDAVVERVHLHAGPGTDPGRLSVALEAAEAAVFRLRAEGWPTPVPDGGRGGTPGLDLYLQDGIIGAVAGLDGEDALSVNDGAIAYGLVDAHVPLDALPACVAAAVAQAALLAADPAEAEAWRQASGALFAWRATGTFGCTNAVADNQRHPERGLLHRGSGEEGALFLSLLSERADGGSGRFIRDMWYFAQQDSRDAGALRASPDLWEATARALSNASEDLDDVTVDFAVARFFVGPDRAYDGHGSATLSSLGQDARVPLRAELDAGSLPRHVYPEPGLQALGSSYALVRTPDASEQDQLQVWLRGEPGPRWSLAAVQLDHSGREIGRMVAPARRTPRSYLPIWLSPQTASVLLVVTHLPRELPDADEPAPPAAHFKLIVDLARPA